jgi:hypothetical protein
MRETISKRIDRRYHKLSTSVNLSRSASLHTGNRLDAGDNILIYSSIHISHEGRKI